MKTVSFKAQTYLPTVPMFDRQVEQLNACAWSG
jgi:hypothetical protein